MKLLGNSKKGMLFVVSAPAGTGKTTLVRMLTKEFSCIKESISCTTRQVRPGEVPDEDYHFLSKEDFQKKIKQGDFLEHAEVFGHLYGTSKEFVEKQESLGRHVVLVIDTQGAMQLKGKIPAVFIFISPPSLEELKVRLLKRQTEDVDSVEKRLSWAKKEMGMVSHYDYHIINDRLETAYECLRSILIAEEHKVRRQV